MCTSSPKETVTCVHTQKWKVSIYSQPNRKCQRATVCALHQTHKRDSKDASSYYYQKRQSLNRNLKSKTQIAVRIITKHDSAQHCARDIHTQPMTKVHKMHVRFATKRDSLVPNPKVNSKPSLASRGNVLAHNNLHVTANPDNDSQDACALHHQTAQSHGPIPESKKQAFAHNTTRHVSAQPAPQLSHVIIVHSD